MTDPIEDYFLSPSPAARRRSKRFFAELMGVELPEPEIQAPQFQRLGCPHCQFLGGTHHNGQAYDLYYCTREESVLSMTSKDRFDGNQYLDEPEYRQVALECLVRAVGMGLLTLSKVLTGCKMRRVGDYLGDNDG